MSVKTFLEWTGASFLAGMALFFLFLLGLACAHLYREFKDNHQ
jgi:hypothetical protein